GKRGQTSLFAGDIRLYGESFIYRKPLMIDDNEGIIYALKLAGCPRSLAPTLAGEILFRCSRLCGLKRLPGVPGAFPILFLRPTSGFQEMKVGRSVRPFAEMTDGKKRFVDSTVLHLRAIKFVTNAGAIGRGVEPVSQILQRQITGDSRKCDWFAVALSQFVGG